jgi:integrase/recombinase XerD
MKLTVAYQPSVPASASPYRLHTRPGREIRWANDFLDAQRLRQLSLRSLRIYAYDLLHFARWWTLHHHTGRDLQDLTPALLVDYVRAQLDQDPPPTPQTINHRLTVLHCLYRFHYGREISTRPADRHTGSAPPFRYARRRRRLVAGLRLKQPRRVVVPLSAQQVAQFWNSFRTFRDLALVALMLLDGLRSCEVLALSLEDLNLAQAQILVLGKGNKKRLLPLPEETIQALQNYLRIERPLTNSPALFVSLKGRQRGRPLAPAGLRSLFRHHRLRSQVPQANAHRLRHTFGADMVRAGISLPALMHLMGHAHIHTTMLYVQLAPQDVWREFARALQNRVRLPSTALS